LNRPKRLRKRDPYFKVVSPHSDNCLIKKDIDNTVKQTKYLNDGFYGAEDEYFDSAVRLNLNAPSNKRPSQIKNTGSGNDDGYSLVRRKVENEGGKRKIQHSKTLGSMIDSFLRGENFVVQMPNIGLINLKDLFVKIDNQNINELPDEYRIYYGTAWFNKLNDQENYQVRFANNLSCYEVSSPPTVFIPKSYITESSYSKFNEKKFEKLVSNIPRMVLILSESGPFLKDEKYINIWLEGLEYIEYRSLS